MSFLSKLLFKKAKLEKIVNETKPNTNKPKPTLDSYVVVDVETTGLNPIRNDIIEFGAVKVINNEITEVFSELVKPKDTLRADITRLTGITEDMLAFAPSINRILPKFLEFIGDSVIIGHNIDFDTDFISIACQRFKLPFNNSVVDTLEMSNMAFPNLPNHKLSTLCQHCGIENKDAHRALSDCLAEKELFEILQQRTLYFITPHKNIKLEKRFNTKDSEKTKGMKELLNIVDGIISDGIITEDEVMELRDWLDANPQFAGNYPFDRIKTSIDKALEDGILEDHELEDLLDLFQRISMPRTETIAEDALEISEKVICLTGEFSRGSFDELSEELSAMGAIIRKAVSGKVDYLVIGNYGSPEWSFGSYGSDYKKVMELQDKGKQVKVISEDELFSKCSLLQTI